MRKTAFRAACLLLALALSGCAGDVRVPVGGTRLDPARVYGDIAVLASDAFEGRTPGKPGSQRAVEMVADRFRALGLVPAPGREDYLQTFPFQQWTQTVPTFLEIGGELLTEGIDYQYNIYSDPASLTAEMVFAGYGMTVPPYDRDEYPDCPLDPSGYDDYEGLDVEGKIVVLMMRTPRDDPAIQDGCPANLEVPPGNRACLGARLYKARNAALHGAGAILFTASFAHAPPVLMFGYRADSQGNPATLYTPPDRLQIHLPDLGDWMARIDEELRPNGRHTGLAATVQADSTVSQTSIPNVVGVLPGSDPALAGEVILFGAHLDHFGTRPNGDVYRGADDNASGVATVLELARVAAESRLNPARTLVFAAFNAEEPGIIGSCHYVNSDPLFPVQDTRAMFSVDMVGVGFGNGLELAGASDPHNAWLARVMAGSAAEMGYVHEVRPAAPMLSSDHACFALAGVPAVNAESLEGEDHADYHTPRDTMEIIRLDTLRSTLELLWAVLVPLAQGTEQRYIDRPAAGNLQSAPAVPRPPFRFDPAYDPLPPLL